MIAADATVSSPTDSDGTSQRFIAARVLSHPDPGRVGDFVPLFDVPPGAAAGGPVAELSRLAPDFRRPAGQRSGPLASSRISRTPLRMERTAEGLSLTVSTPQPEVRVDGRPLETARSVSAEQLQDGVIVRSGRDLVLWIGWLDLIEPAPPVVGLVGESTAMRKLRQQIHRVADLDVPVLLRGATGVGKELVADAIHRHSRRAARSYVAVNVAGVPPSMAASELFGHKKGAFTNAFQERKGYFAQADQGTLFLDEIGDVSFDVQALLLRAVQEGVIQPLGGSTCRVDVRLIAATDSDLESAVARREFREPLLRRFSYEIHVPPLRARREDIGLLFYHLLRERLNGMGEGHRLAPGPGEAAPFVPGVFVELLALHDWPGNVRELANVALKFAIENRGRDRAVIGDELRELLRPRAPEVGPAAATAAPHPERRQEPSDEEVLAALRLESFRRERAAKRLGVSKSYLYKRLEGKTLVPSAADFSEGEITGALSDCGGDLRSAAARLRVSERALRLQLKRLRPSTR